MRLALTVAAFAPLALLAACGDGTPAEDTATTADLAAPSASDTPAPAMAAGDQSSAELPSVPEDSLDTVNYDGTYTRNGAGGSERLTLNSKDNTYEYTGGDGTVRKGSYSRMDDNRRLAIEDFDGKPAYFTITDGSIFRMDSVDTPADRITVTGRYDRHQPGEPLQGGPQGAVSNVNDKRGG